MEIDNSLHQSFEKPVSETRTESNPLLPLLNLIVAQGRFSRDGKDLPAAATANTIALEQLRNQV